jgi:hypothetical protein
MDKVVFEVTREYAEQILDSKLTDEQWSVLQIEIRDFLDYYTKDELPRLYGDIENILAEHAGEE